MKYNCYGFLIVHNRSLVLIRWRSMLLSGAHNERGKGRGEEREAPTHLIKNSKPTHAARVTKNRQNLKVCSSHPWSQPLAAQNVFTGDGQSRHLEYHCASYIQESALSLYQASRQTSVIYTTQHLAKTPALYSRGACSLAPRE